jgi:hypothetical protein
LEPAPHAGRGVTRRPKPSEDERRALLRSLAEVGPSKPIGYLPLYAIEEFVQLSPQSVADAVTARGLTTALFGPSECCIKSGALYVYHREALVTLLQERAAVLIAVGLPLDPDRFVAQIAAVWFEKDHPAYSVIATAFGDGS